jgi:hypothetical protein
VRRAAVALITMAALAGCGSAAHLAGNPSSTQQPNAQAPNAYLATGSGWINYLQWDSQGTGSLTDDTLTGTAPDEQVSSNQTPITVYVNGSEVTLSGLNPDTGTLANGTLTLQVLNPDGTLGTDTFTPATQDQFNQAVAVLQAQAASDNGAAVQASASASQASANAVAEQQAQADLATVQGISFSSDLNSLAGDVTTTNNDLGTVKSDAANGPGADCSNLEGTVDGDVEGTIDGDMEGSTEGTLQGNLIPDIASARQEISTFQGDLSTLQGLGLPAPSGASAAISAAQGTISSAVSQGNQDISQVNADVVTAYQVANGIATSSCDGPGSAPASIPAIS